MPAAKRAFQSNANDSCKKITDLIFNYLTDRLTPALRREFERHLRICPDCVNFLNTYKKTISLTGSLSAREIPRNVRATVLAFLRQKMHRIAVLFFSLIAHATS
jgi:anti-sigma factor RsiW